jgi:hypothetical protein
MKKMILVLCLIVMQRSIAFCHEEHFETYNEQVTKAEMNIIDGDFKSAMQHYKLAFEQKENPFASDLYNASVAAIKTGNYTQAFALCNRLATKGAGGVFFEKKTAFQPLKKQPAWEALIKTAELEKNRIKKEQGETIKWVNGLVDKDQEWHTIWSKSDFNQTLEMQMAAADDSLSGELMKVFDRQGYLSEDVIGANVTDDTTINFPAHWIIILHNYQGRHNTEDTLFTPILRKALSEGKISPRFFAYLQDHGSNMIRRPVYGTGRGYNIWQCNLYKYPTNAIAVSDIETNRRSIGLGTLAEDEQRIFYTLNRKDYDFIIYGEVSTTGSFANKESEQRFLETSLLVLKDICHVK